jgi:hypothetical protein
MLSLLVKNWIHRAGEEILSQIGVTVAEKFIRCQSIDEYCQFNHDISILCLLSAGIKERKPERPLKITYALLAEALDPGTAATWDDRDLILSIIP